MLDGKSSLNPSTGETTEHPNRHSAMAIESITVHDAKLMGHGSPTTIFLNPWLNTIIGGRGTGKSTLVDFCRKTLRRDDELNSTDSQEEGSLRNLFDRRMQVPSSRLSEGLLTDSTRIKIVYRKDGERFRLAWSQDGTAQPISRLDGNGSISEDGGISERFPIRIYSQKQLFALAQDPNALLNVIDDAQDVRGVEYERRTERLKAEYLSLRASEGKLLSLGAELSDVRHKLDVLEQGGYADVLNTYRTRRAADDTWELNTESLRGGVEVGKGQRERSGGC